MKHMMIAMLAATGAALVSAPASAQAPGPAAHHAQASASAPKRAATKPTVTKKMAAQPAHDDPAAQHCQHHAAKTPIEHEALMRAHMKHLHGGGDRPCDMQAAHGEPELKNNTGPASGPAPTAQP